MAKQTVISPAYSINTGRAPAGLNGANGGQVVRVDLYFDQNTTQQNISLTDVMQNGCFNTVQCLYIDNSLNPSTVILTFPGIQQRIIVNGFTQSLEPIYISDSTCATPIIARSIYANAPGFPVSLWFSNVPQPFYQKTDLVNTVFNTYQTASFGNVNGTYAYFWAYDLTNVMVQNSVADWQTIYVDNSSGFQHVDVYDETLGVLIYSVPPYSIAQFPTNGVGSSLYSFYANDYVLGSWQNNFTYGYNVTIRFKSYKQPFFQSPLGQSGLYTLTLDQAFTASQLVVTPINESRRRIALAAPNMFYYNVGLAWYAPVLVNGLYGGAVDITSISSLQRGVSILNGATPQTITIRDRY
jgi:hypothetical protein